MGEDLSSTAAEPSQTGPGLVDRAAGAVLAYRDGDRESLGQLVTDLTPLLWHTVRSQGVEHDRAQDVVQGVWLALLRDVDSIRDPKATLQWLLVTARRSAWRAVREQRAGDRRTTDDDGLDELVAPRDEIPDVMAVRGERDRALWAHVQELPERCRTLLRLVALVDRPDYAVVSRSLGMPVGSIGPTRGRCLAKLRAALAADPAWEA